MVIEVNLETRASDCPLRNGDDCRCQATKNTCSLDWCMGDAKAPDHCPLILNPILVKGI